MLKEYETKFKIGEIVKFYVGDEPYIGEIGEILQDKYQRNLFKYEISSGSHNFIRFENEIETYETEIDEGYICDNCLLSNILDDIEKGKLTANEAREILDFESIVSDGVLFSEDKEACFDFNSGEFRISTEDGSWTWIENEEEPNKYAEYKTSGNAYFSIFPDDEHEDAVHIEINPSWLWTNDDIDELIEQLKLAKRMPKLIPGPYFDPHETTFTEYTEWASTSVKDFVELYDKLNIPSQEKEVFVVKTPYNYSEEDCTKLKEYIEKPFTNAGRNVEILILQSDIDISPA